MVSRELLGVLACPKCKGSVALHGMFITCQTCGLAYPVKDDVPDMLIEDAWAIQRARKAGFRHELNL